jgi:hypothetical protein
MIDPVAGRQRAPKGAVLGRREDVERQRAPKGAVLDRHELQRPRKRPLFILVGIAR